jgi:hypothetical protein
VGVGVGVGVSGEAGGGTAGEAGGGTSVELTSAQLAILVPRHAVHLRGMRPDKIGFLQAAEELAAEIDGLLPLVRAEAAHAADNLERSAESAVFNIGEGVGAFRPKVKIASYDIAKRRTKCA